MHRCPGQRPRLAAVDGGGGLACCARLRAVPTYLRLLCALARSLLRPSCARPPLVSEAALVGGLDLFVRSWAVGMVTDERGHGATRRYFFRFGRLRFCAPAQSILCRLNICGVTSGTSPRDRCLVHAAW